MVNIYTPERGDIVMLQFHPQRGREQAGWRPALVLSPERYNAKVGLMLACPITSTAKGYPFEIALPLELRTHGVILTDHVKSLDYIARDARFVERVPRDILQRVLQKILLLVGEGV